MSITTSKTQPALIGGLVMGALSALPIVAAGNLCCCLWMISGGLVAAYILQQNQPEPIDTGDGALVGLLAGLVGAVVYLILSIPITLLLAPMERAVFQRLLETTGSLPPELREAVERYGGRDGEISIGVRVARFAAGFIMTLFLGALFSTLGGLLGAIFFRKPSPRIDTPPAG